MLLFLQADELEGLRYKVKLAMTVKSPKNLPYEVWERVLAKVCDGIIPTFCYPKTLTPILSCTYFTYARYDWSVDISQLWPRPSLTGRCGSRP